MDYSGRCLGCREIYAERNPPEEPPCYTCRILPFEENVDALKVFLITRYQFVSDSVGPIDINHLAIESVMKREGIEDRQTFDKVLNLNRWWISRIRK